MSVPQTFAVYCDSFDRATALAQQLEALLQAAIGTGGENLRNLSDEIQENYAWACADLADQLNKALRATAKAGCAA